MEKKFKVIYESSKGMLTEIDVNSVVARGVEFCLDGGYIVRFDLVSGVSIKSGKFDNFEDAKKFMREL